jgi:hypothetical protein
LHFNIVTTVSSESATQNGDVPHKEVAGLERRREIRRLSEGQYLGLSSNDSVQVLELSVAGVLLHTTVPLPVGSRAQLRLSVSGSPLIADVEVRRVLSLGIASSGYHIGARFLMITPQHRQLVERFLNQ